MSTHCMCNYFHGRIRRRSARKALVAQWFALHDSMETFTIKSKPLVKDLVRTLRANHKVLELIGHARSSYRFYADLQSLEFVFWWIKVPMDAVTLSVILSAEDESPRMRDSVEAAPPVLVYAIVIGFDPSKRLMTLAHWVSRDNKMRTFVAPYDQPNLQWMQVQTMDEKHRIRLWNRFKVYKMHSRPSLKSSSDHYVLIKPEDPSKVVEDLIRQDTITAVELNALLQADCVICKPIAVDPLSKQLRVQEWSLEGLVFKQPPLTDSEVFCLPYSSWELLWYSEDVQVAAEAKDMKKQFLSLAKNTAPVLRPNTAHSPEEISKQFPLNQKPKLQEATGWIIEISVPEETSSEDSDDVIKGIVKSVDFKKKMLHVLFDGETEVEEVPYGSTEIRWIHIL